jgi:hypothetical protein
MKGFLGRQKKCSFAITSDVEENPTDEAINSHKCIGQALIRRVLHVFMSIDWVEGFTKIDEYGS